MRLTLLGAFALAIRLSTCYLDTSPFFSFSTSSDFTLKSKGGIQTSASLTKNVYNELLKCPSEYYIIVTQPGVSTSDYTNSKNTPNLAQKLSLSPHTKSLTGVQSQLTIPELLDQPNVASWERVLSENCDVINLSIDGSTGSIPSLKLHRLLTVSLPAPSKSSRSADLSKNDAYLASLLDMLPSKGYTVLYVTSPSLPSSNKKDDNKLYEMDSPLVDLFHQELKRDLGVHGLAKGRSNQTIIDGPLFEKYQFFTPGIFMCLTVGLVLLLILYVGISGLASLQVSYGAFEKDSGPLAAKKAQ